MAVARQEVADAALKMLDVDAAGLDVMDRKLLQAVIEKFGGGPVGVDNLAAALSEERDTIEWVLARLLALPEDLDILVVDDSSPDGTGDLVRAVAAEEPRVRLLERPQKGGLGSAYLDGFRLGLADGYDLGSVVRRVEGIYRSALSANGARNAKEVRWLDSIARR